MIFIALWFRVLATRLTMPQLVLGQIATNLIYLIYWLEVRFAFNCRCFERCRHLIFWLFLTLLGAYSYCSSDIFALNTPRGKTKRTNAAPLNSVNFYFALFFFFWFFFWGQKLGYFGFAATFVTVSTIWHLCTNSCTQPPLVRHSGRIRIQRFCGVDSFFEALPANGQWITFFHSCFAVFVGYKWKKKMFVKNCYKIFFAFLVTACWVLLLQTICVLHLTANKKWRQQQISYFCLRKFSGGREFIVVVRWLNTKSKL